MADTDVRMRPAKKAVGSEYDEYMLLYNDALVISERGTARASIDKHFELMEKSSELASLCVDGQLRRLILDDGVKAWAFSTSEFVQETVKSVKKYLATTDRAETPTSHLPEVKVSLGPKSTDSTCNQSFTGILRWFVELERVDLCLELSMIPLQLALPQDGRLIFACLRKYHKTEHLSST